MARTPQVTRTMKTTVCTVLCANTVEQELCNKKVTLPRTYKDTKELLKATKKAIETDTLKVVDIVDTKVEETLYGMTEQDFIAHATPLPPRTTNTETAESVSE